MDEMALTVKKEPEEDVEYFHQANLEMERVMKRQHLSKSQFRIFDDHNILVPRCREQTEINFPIKQEKVFVEDWRHYQEQESGSDLLTLPPFKEEFDLETKLLVIGSIE
uniref:Uncharacterized protein n=1 Tax=Timema bartmani TaxID=61472 RepID=A0A7R9F598_9NEOP|nr:unnamed protein product [Timema bartmani]